MRTADFADAAPQRSHTPNKVSSDVSPSGTSSRAHKLQRNSLKSPRQQSIMSERQKMERLERMTELWGSPDGSDIAAYHPFLSKQSSTLGGTPVKDSAANNERQRGSNKNQVASNRMQASPKTPTASAASCIPRFSSPSAAFDVLKALHASMTSAMSNVGLSPKTVNDKTGISRIPVFTPTAQVKLRSSPSPLKENVQQPLAKCSPASQTAAKVSRPAEADWSPRHRSGEEVLSTEEQELKVRCSFDDFRIRAIFSSFLVSCALSRLTSHPNPKCVRRLLRRQKLQGLMMLSCGCSAGKLSAKE